MRHTVCINATHRMYQCDTPYVSMRHTVRIYSYLLYIPDLKRGIYVKSVQSKTLFYAMHYYIQREHHTKL